MKKLMKYVKETKIGKVFFVAVIAILIISAIYIAFGITTFIVNADEVEIVTEVDDTTEMSEVISKLNKIKSELKDSKLYQYLTIGLAAVVTGLAGICIKLYGKFKSFKAAFKISDTTTDELTDVLKKFDKDTIVSGLQECMKDELQLIAKDVLAKSDVKTEELSKIVSENKLLKAYLDKMTEAMKLAWGDKVDGVVNLLNEPVEQLAYDELATEKVVLEQKIAELEGALNDKQN